MNKRVAIGLTPSIDAVAALILLKLQNYDVQAVHVLVNSSLSKQVVDVSSVKCHAEVNQELLSELCSFLNVPLHFIDQNEIFYDQVIAASINANFLKEYFNPCLSCNNIKISAIYNKMGKLNCELMATGHYAKLRIIGKGGLVSLSQFADPAYDQHSFLATLDQSILTKLLLPLGDLNRAKAINIIKEHLPKFVDQLTQGLTGKKSCEVLKDSSGMLKEHFAPSLCRKSRFFLREKNTFLSEHFDNTEFQFGEVFNFPYTTGKGFQVNGFNYSNQVIYVDIEGTETGANYYSVQIVQYFGEPSFYMPTKCYLSFNEEDEGYSATIYFKGLNYAVITLHQKYHPFVANKSLIYIYDKNMVGKKLLFLGKVVLQARAVKEGEIVPLAEADIKNDFPL